MCTGASGYGSQWCVEIGFLIRLLLICVAGKSGGCEWDRDDILVFVRFTVQFSVLSRLK